MDVLELKTTPPVSLTPVECIDFFHPGYEPSEQPLLFSLPVIDQSRDHPARWGMYHETALAACRIIAANRPGRLTTDRAGSSPVETPLHGILTGNAYYYVVDGSPAVTKYPIIPTFGDWPFPTNGLPEEWVCQPSTTGLTGRCQLTDQRFAERAHLVPRPEGEWLARSPLNRLPDTINCERNLVELRSDLHGMFDRKMFALVPKRSDPTHRRVFVAHILDDAACGYFTTLHNYTVQHLEGHAGPFLYARFAWAILFRTKAFLTAGPERVVAVRSATGGTEVKTMLGAALKQAYGGGGLRDATPLKRTWTRRSGDLCDQEAADDDDDEAQRYRYLFGTAPYDQVSQTVEDDAGLAENTARTMSEG